MESLESKLERLSPEQRREAENFVDFLLFRSEGENIFRPSSGNHSPEINSAPPILPAIDAMHNGENRPAGMPDAPDDVPSCPFREIGAGMDHMTRDYMDYGQFEKQPLPGSEATRKVRIKINEKERQSRPHHILDWMD